MQMNTKGECNNKMLENLSLFGHLGKACAAVTYSSDRKRSLENEYEEE